MMVVGEGEGRVSVIHRHGDWWPTEGTLTVHDETGSGAGRKGWLSVVILL